MNIDIQTLALESMRTALLLAKEALDQNLPLESIDTVSASRKFVDDKLTRLADSKDKTIHFISVSIETDEDDVEDSAEFSEVIRLLKDGYLCGFNGNEGGRFNFDVHTIIRK